MSHRVVPLMLLALLLSLHAQLWLGRGSVSHVNQLQAKLNSLNEQNQAAILVNQKLAAEVRDLKEGLEMVEAIARGELGMVKPNEILVQYAR